MYLPFFFLMVAFFQVSSYRIRFLGPKRQGDTGPAFRLQPIRCSCARLTRTGRHFSRAVKDARLGFLEFRDEPLYPLSAFGVKLLLIRLKVSQKPEKLTGVNPFLVGYVFEHLYGQLVINLFGKLCVELNCFILCGNHEPYSPNQFRMGEFSVVGETGKW